MTANLAEADKMPETIINKKPLAYGVLLLLAALIAGGVFFISRFNANDYARDVQNWKEKLNLIAESRRESVADFIAGNFAELRSLADNPSLKLYLTEIQATEQNKEGKEDAGGESAQKTYLRNLLVFTAARGGFSIANAVDAIPANIPVDSKSGLAVLDNNNKLIVGTQMISSASIRLTEHAKAQQPGKEELVDIRKDADGTPYIGFIVPVYSIQGDKTPEGQIGKIVALKTIDDNLFGLLKQPGTTEKTLEILLARTMAGSEGVMEFISPLKDGSGLLEKQISSEKSDSAEASVMREKNNFSSETNDYRGRAVIAVSRDISGTNWKLIAKIDKAEAFVESGAHRAGLIASFSLVVAVIALIIIAMWWYASSRHALMASDYFKQSAAKSQAQERLLRLVTDYQPEKIYIVDSEKKYRFANKQKAESVDMSAEDIFGKTMADVQGAAKAEGVSEKCDAALSGRQPVYDVSHEGSGRNEIVIRSGYIPLEEIPISDLPQGTKGVLVVEQDVSEIYHERERRLAIQRQLVQTLLSLVDKRDPFAANHSVFVSQIARRIAEELELDPLIVETAQTSASLMNIGKIVISTELLTKTGPLSEDEKKSIRASMDAASDLIKKVPFEGPVVETLRCWQERPNGSGLLGLKGDEIIVTARIIAVANAFVGMISPRSWRNAMTVEAAGKFLLENVGTYFDQKVVVALIHYIDTKAGRDWLDNILKNSKDAA